MTTSSSIESQALTSTLRQFKMRKRTFEERLDAVRAERDDLRHMVSIPLNPRARQQPLLDEEKDSRLVEVFVKVDKGHYFQSSLSEEIGERLMSRLWEINF
jgi:hypothetical protein